MRASTFGVVVAAAACLSCGGAAEAESSGIGAPDAVVPIAADVAKEPGACRAADPLPALAPPPSGRCEGLVPALGAPSVRSFDTGGFAACMDGAVDGAGRFAAWAMYEAPTFAFTTSAVFGADGARASLTADGPLQRSTLAGRPEGFLAWHHPEGAVAIDGSGAARARVEAGWPIEAGLWTLRSGYTGARAIIEDGEGGLLVATAGPDGAGQVGIHAVHVAASGALRAGPFTVASGSGISAEWGALAMAKDHEGRFLVAWTGGSPCGDAGISARWHAPDGAPLGPVFRVADRGSVESAATLPDGTIVLRVGGAWTLRLAGGLAAVGPAPAWLATRTGTELRVVRGGAAIALLIPDDALDPGSRQRIELVTPAGAACGTLELPPRNADEGPLRRHPVIGFDGTIVQSGGVEGRSDPLHTRCEYRFWRGALR